MADYAAIERELDAIGGNAPPQERLEQALTICAFDPVSGVPNYQSFKNWIIPQLLAEQDLVRKDPTYPIATTLLFATHHRLAASGQVLRKEDINSEADLAEFHKLKLLFSLRA